MRSLRKHIANEEGGTIVLVAVSMVGLLAMAALAIDLGMLHDARSEAHRAADAAALAGAATFQTPMDAAQVTPVATGAATDYAGRNRVLGTSVQPSEVTVQVLAAEGKLRATIRRQGISLWFARVFGVNASGVAASAAAAIVSSGTAECLAPFMIPDWWVDANDNQLYDASPTPGEYYDPLVTGYGLDYRNVGKPHYKATYGDYTDDFGRQMILRIGSTGGGMSPGWYFPARIGDNTGGADFRTQLGMACPPGVASIGDPVYPEPGVKQGPTVQGLKERLSHDSDAKWDNTTKSIVGSKYPLGCVEAGTVCTGEGSPRIMQVPLFDPRSPIPNGSSAPLPIVNFGAFFIEEMTAQGDITGRWLRVRGVPDQCLAKGTCRSYMTALRLVE